MRRRFALLFVLPGVLAVGCSSSSSSLDGPIPDTTVVGDDAGPETDAETGPTIGADLTVDGFVATPVYFTGADNQRIVENDATFPDSGTYAKITLHLSLECPSGKCDAWDRFATLGIVTAKGDKPENDTTLELARFITPYGVGASWDLDVTDLRPALRGKLTLRTFIDTWVGPGSASGNGWLVNASFEMTGGVPEREAIAVIPIWTLHSGVYGDPAKPLATSFPAQTAKLPTGASSYAVRALITGHGQGNLENCAEFCARDHTITVGATPHVQKIWRTDCATTAAPGQKGTYKLSRAGWCPGADVRPWTFDVTADITAGAQLAYDAATYANTCRPDAATCAGCSLGTDCAYDGGNHTEPAYFVSAVLIAYR